MLISLEFKAGWALNNGDNLTAGQCPAHRHAASREETMDAATNRLARNIRRVAHLDLPGGGQVVVQDGYAYVGHMKPPYGPTILDVRDPKTPRIHSEIRSEERRVGKEGVRP